MRDRQLFERETLPNGITVFHYPDARGFGEVRIMVPVGSMHNAGPILPGTAHFMEHCIFKRSQKYPEYFSFDRTVGEHGAYWNASTHRDWTVYTLEAETSSSSVLLPGFIDHIFRPVFRDEDLTKERGVVMNERGERRWFPGTTEYGQYLWTEWMHFTPCSKRQVFGEDEDLAKIDAHGLEAFHSFYEHQSIKVLATGELDYEILLRELGSLGTKLQRPSEATDGIFWKRREYHEKTFRDVGRVEYSLGGLVDVAGFEEIASFYFLGWLFKDLTHGPIYKWLREDLGSYELNWHADNFRDQMFWMFTVPLNSVDQVRTVRSELLRRMEAACADRDLLRLMAEKRKKESVTYFQTVGSINNGAQDDLQLYGRIYSMQENIELDERCKDPAHVKKTFEKFFEPGNLGEFCALPAR